MSEEGKNWTVKTDAGYYAKKHKPGNYYRGAIWYWTPDPQKARRLTEMQAINVRTTLFIESKELFPTSAVVNLGAGL